MHAAWEWLAERACPRLLVDIKGRRSRCRRWHPPRMASRTHRTLWGIQRPRGRQALKHLASREPLKLAYRRVQSEELPRRPASSSALPRGARKASRSWPERHEPPCHVGSRGVLECSQASWIPSSRERPFDEMLISLEIGHLRLVSLNADLAAFECRRQ